LTENDYSHYVGIDWATQAHAVCVLDRERHVIAELEVPHTGQGIASLIAKLETLASMQSIAVGIEIPRGSIVEALVERGAHVYALNPKQLDRFRDRHTVAGAKDDRRDAFVLGDSLRTDRHSYRRVELDNPKIVELREISRMDEELKNERSQLTNRLREQLHRYYEQALALSPGADDSWVWAILEKAPTPSAARKLRPKTVQTILKEHRIRRIKPHEVVTILQRRPLDVAPGTVNAAAKHVTMLLPRLRLVHEQIKHTQAEMERLLDELEQDPEPRREQRDVRVLRSLPGLGRNVAATLLAEASQPLSQRDYQTLRAQAGAAPVTRQSGKTKAVVMRRACNRRLRNALYHWARVAAQIDDASRSRYSALRAKGHSHGRALRGLADRLLRTLFAMLRDGTTYDPSRSRAAPPAALLPAPA
jgi:transposase